MYPALGILAVYLLMSLWAFGAYWVDKRAAAAGRRRVRERSLHLLELAGGWPGAWAAQRLLRHKTIDRAFRLVFWAIVLLHAAAWAAVAYSRFT